MTRTLASGGQATPFSERTASELARGAVLELQVGDEKRAVDSETAALVLRLLDARDAGLVVVIDAMPEEITTGQAAELLGTTRPTVVAMVDRGELSARRIGTHRRLSRDEVLQLRTRTVSQRKGALDELTSLSMSAGMYD